MESPIYYCRVSTTSNGERIALMLGDYFNVSFRVAHHSLITRRERSMCYYPSLRVPCYGLIQEGRDFLRRLLLLLQFSIESLDEIVEGVVSMVQYLFQYDVVTLRPPPVESQYREFPLRVEIVVYNFGVELEIEDSNQNFNMIPASDEAIQTSLKKFTVTKQSECPICLEEMEVNAECYVMSCDHAFHQECIVTWLQISHLCPLCRYSLPTIEN